MGLLLKWLYCCLDDFVAFHAKSAIRFSVSSLYASTCSWRFGAAPCWTYFTAASKGCRSVGSVSNALFHHVGESFLLQYRPLIRLCESFLNDQPAKCDRKILMSTCDKRASIGAAVAPFANFGRQDPPPFCSGTRPM